MASAAEQRLALERKELRRDRPFGFSAKPCQAADGSTNLRVWECIVPGPEGTPWQGGFYPLTLHFDDSYPMTPPVATFDPGFFHCNVYPEGTVCLSILDADADMGGQWAPNISIKQVLLGIQELLANPNKMSPAQNEAWQLLDKKPAEYARRVELQALKYAAPA